MRKAVAQALDRGFRRRSQRRRGRDPVAADLQSPKLSFLPHSSCCTTRLRAVPRPATTFAMLHPTLTLPFAYPLQEQLLRPRPQHRNSYPLRCGAIPAEGPECFAPCLRKSVEHGPAGASRPVRSAHKSRVFSICRICLTSDVTTLRGRGCRTRSSLSLLVTSTRGLKARTRLGTGSLLLRRSPPRTRISLPSQLTAALRRASLSRLE